MMHHRSSLISLIELQLLAFVRFAQTGMVAWLPLLVALGAAARVPVVTTGGSDRRTITHGTDHLNGRLCPGAPLFG